MSIDRKYSDGSVSVKKHKLLKLANKMLQRYFDECTDQLCAENITEKEADYYVDECEQISQLITEIDRTKYEL